MKVGIVVPFSWSFWGAVLEHAELQAEALRARGLDDVRVERISLGDFAREAGLPEDVVVYFGGPGAPFLIASKH